MRVRSGVIGAEEALFSSISRALYKKVGVGIW